MKKYKDCRDCKHYEDFENSGYCAKYDSMVSDPKENYCNG